MNPSMESFCLSFRDIPQTSKLFSTFLEDFQRVGKYYGHAPSIGGVAAAAKEVKIDPAGRAGVGEGLRGTWSGWLAARWRLLPGSRWDFLRGRLTVCTRRLRRRLARRSFRGAEW